MTHAETLTKRCENSVGLAIANLETAIERYERSVTEVNRVVARHERIAAALELAQANSIKARKDAWTKSRKSGK